MPKISPTTTESKPSRAPKKATPLPKFVPVAEAPPAPQDQLYAQVIASLEADTAAAVQRAVEAEAELAKLRLISAEVNELRGLVNMYNERLTRVENNVVNATDYAKNTYLMVDSMKNTLTRIFRT